MFAPLAHHLKIWISIISSYINDYPYKKTYLSTTCIPLNRYKTHRASLNLYPVYMIRDIPTSAWVQGRQRSRGSSTMHDCFSMIFTTETWKIGDLLAGNSWAWTRWLFTWMPGTGTKRTKNFLTTWTLNIYRSIGWCTDMANSFTPWLRAPSTLFVKSNFYKDGHEWNMSHVIVMKWINYLYLDETFCAFLLRLFQQSAQPRSTV